MRRSICQFSLSKIIAFEKKDSHSEITMSKTEEDKSGSWQAFKRIGPWMN